MSGKGDAYRPVDKAKFDANFEKIFGKRELNLSRREDYDDTQVEKAISDTKWDKTQTWRKLIRGN